MMQWLSLLISLSACFDPGHLLIEFRMGFGLYSKYDLFLPVLICGSFRNCPLE